MDNKKSWLDSLPKLIVLFIVFNLLSMALDASRGREVDFLFYLVDTIVLLVVGTITYYFLNDRSFAPAKASKILTIFFVSKILEIIINFLIFALILK